MLTSDNVNRARDALIHPFNIFMGAVEKETDLDILEAASRRKEKVPHQHQPCCIRFSPTIIIAHYRDVRRVPKSTFVHQRCIYLYKDGKTGEGVYVTNSFQ